MKYRIGSTGLPFEADGFLGSGGEGSIVGVPSRPDLVAKIFAAPTQLLRDKLEAMRRKPPSVARGVLRHHRIAWPQELVFAERQDLVVGYTMAKVSQALPFASFCYPHLRGGGAADRLFNVAIDICDTLASLHQDGYVVVDGNDANVLVVGDRITWIDTDSFQIPGDGRTFTSAVGHPEFTPTESIGRRKDAILKPSHDLFALGVMMFKLLFEGRHPFMCRYLGNNIKPSLPDRIARGEWPYGSKAPRSYSPPNDGKKFADLHPELRDRFKRCFEEGHRDPERRPTASEWRTILDRLRSQPFPARRSIGIPALGALTPRMNLSQDAATESASEPDSTWESLFDPKTWVLTVQLLMISATAIVLIILAMKVVEVGGSLGVSCHEFAPVPLSISTGNGGESP